MIMIIMVVAKKHEVVELKLHDEGTDSCKPLFSGLDLKRDSWRSPIASKRKPVNQTKPPAMSCAVKWSGPPVCAANNGCEMVKQSA